MSSPATADACAEASARSFVYTAQSPRVVFGAGSLSRLGEEIDALGVRRALILSGPTQRAGAERVAELLGPRAAGIFDGARMHVPIAIAREARRIAAELGADCALAVGGGSTIGLGKAIALESGLPIVALPTTYAGSEMTPIYGITEAGVKKTGRDRRVLPRTVIYDPELSRALPAALSITSGINAIAHAAEGLYALDGNPVISLIAVEGMGALARALPLIHRDPGDRRARTDALYGAWLCGSVLGQVGMALHHKLCHTLGGSFDLPHAETHAVVLPHALAYNAAAAPEAMRRIAAALSAGPAADAAPTPATQAAAQTPSAPQAIQDLARATGAPTSLRALGLREADLDRAAELAVANPYWNPRPVGPAQRTAIRELLQRAFDGASPE